MYVTQGSCDICTNGRHNRNEAKKKFPKIFTGVVSSDPLVDEYTKWVAKHYVSVINIPNITPLNEQVDVTICFDCVHKMEALTNESSTNMGSV